MTKEKTDIAFMGTIDNAILLKAIIKFITKIVDENVITIEKTGLSMAAMDPSHVAMLIALLPKDFWSEYVCNVESNLNVSTIDFGKVLDRSTAADKVILLQKKGDPTLIIKLESSQSKRTFKIKAKDAENLEQYQKEKETLKALEQGLERKFLLRVNILPGLLDQIIKDSLIVSDVVKISGNKPENKLYFSSAEDAGESETELDLSKSEDEGKGIKLISFQEKDPEGEEVKEFSSRYSLAFLEDFVAVQGISTNFKMSIGENVPIKLESEVGWYCSHCGKVVPDGKVEAHEKKCPSNPENADETKKEVKVVPSSQKKGKVVFMIAPRSDENKDDEEESGKDGSETDSSESDDEGEDE